MEQKILISPEIQKTETVNPSPGDPKRNPTGPQGAQRDPAGIPKGDPKGHDDHTGSPLDPKGAPPQGACPPRAARARRTHALTAPRYHTLSFVTRYCVRV